MANIDMAKSEGNGADNVAVQNNQRSLVGHDSRKVNNNGQLPLKRPLEDLNGIEVNKTGAKRDGAIKISHDSAATTTSTEIGLVIVIDFGSQYTQLIARRARELGVQSIIINGGDSTLKVAETVLNTIHARSPHISIGDTVTGGTCVVLSGGPNSVHSSGSPGIDAAMLKTLEEKGIAVLGICYGMQLLVNNNGGVVMKGDRKEYGKMDILVTETACADNDDLTLYRIDAASKMQAVWMSHGDECVSLPIGFEVAAVSSQGGKDIIVAFQCAKRKLFGLQYHPEVTHTEKGLQTLEHFFFDIAKLKGGYSMDSVFLEHATSMICKQVGPDDHAICALSGGVDSAVAAAVVHKAIGDRLHCVFVDNGLLRFEESSRVMKTFKEHLDLPVIAIDHSEVMLEKLKGITDPEKKRKIIGNEFIEVFKKCATDIAQKIGTKPKFLVQGTLYPDVIESCPPPGSDRTVSHTIKSHHNVGGLPEKLGFQLIEPLRWLFKDEVRKLGSVLDVPAAFLKRHPFPGPGLAVRVIGDVTLSGALDVLRRVDEIFINKIKEEGLYDDIWQAFAVFLPIKSVGVQGDCRTHSHVVALRAITSSDGMTADWYPFTPKFLGEVSSLICNSVEEVNRVVYDISSKPPATIEWE